MVYTEIARQQIGRAPCGTVRPVCDPKICLNKIKKTKKHVATNNK